MAKTHEDRVQDEVRRRMTDLASAAGVDRGRIDLEVLFLLPSEFVRGYRRLFSEALADPVSPIGDGGKDEGRIKAAGKPADPMKARSMGGASGGSKRFVAGAWPIRDEKALELKVRLDRKILGLIRESLDTLSRERSGNGDIGAGAPGGQTVPLRCDQCGAFLAAAWKRCPFHD